jgi:excisionase family DNA binding protein
MAVQEMFRVKDIAGRLRVTPARVYQLVSESSLPHVRRGRAIYIPREAWRAYMKSLNDAALAAVSGEAQGAKH